MSFAHVDTSDPCSGKMYRTLIDNETKKVVATEIVDDPDATMWEITPDGCYSRRVGYGVNNANQVKGSAALHVRKSKGSGSDRRGRPRVYCGNAEGRIQKAAPKSEEI